MTKETGKHPMYFQRLNRDITDLLSHNFDCSSSCLRVNKDQNGITLSVCILEGPYRRGHFSFLLDIPMNYPFKNVDVWAKHPIWHPNVDLLTGRVFLPLDWSPVLTLNSLALAVQMMMLEPSTDNALNAEASAYYNSDQLSFEQQVQTTLQGCRYVGVDFPCVIIEDCVFCVKKPMRVQYVNYIPHSCQKDSTAPSDHTMEVTQQFFYGMRKRRCSESDDATVGIADESLKQNSESPYIKSAFPAAARITTIPDSRFLGTENHNTGRFLGTTEFERKALRDFQGETSRKRVKAGYEELSSFDELSIEKDISILSSW